MCRVLAQGVAAASVIMSLGEVPGPTQMWALPPECEDDWLNCGGESQGLDAPWELEPQGLSPTVPFEGCEHINAEDIASICLYRVRQMITKILVLACRQVIS